MTSRDDISDVIALRRAVFCDEQGFSAESEPDAHDAMAVYALALNDDGMPIGTGRLYVDGDRMMIGRVCVLKEWRGKSVGGFIMRMLLYRAQELNAGSVTLSAQAGREAFYARYGFEPFGDIVYDEGRPHRMMRVEGDKIDIGGSCGGCAKGCGECEHGRS